MNALSENTVYTSVSVDKFSVVLGIEGIGKK